MEKLTSRMDETYHDVEIIKDDEGSHVHRMRVPNGWIYEFYCLSPRAGPIIDHVFVPILLPYAYIGREDGEVDKQDG